jgi:hypothetical protein
VHIVKSVIPSEVEESSTEQADEAADHPALIGDVSLLLDMTNGPIDMRAFP